MAYGPLLKSAWAFRKGNLELFKRLDAPSAPPTIWLHWWFTPGGIANIQLANATLVATGASSISGVLAKTLEDASLVSSGSVLVQGALSQLLEEASLVAAGTVPINGILSQVLENASLLATGEVITVTDILGVLNVLLDNATLLATGTVEEALPYTGPIVWVGDSRFRLTSEKGASKWKMNIPSSPRKI
jgi:hypothetical protein